MPRFTEEVQAKVDARHADTELAYEEAQALLKVPAEARLAMPDSRLFIEKKNFVDKGPAGAILDGRVEFGNTAPLISLGKKIQKIFGIKPKHWKYSALQLTKKSGLQSFNCSLTTDPIEWHWNETSLQISAILWLESGDQNILEFPYLPEVPKIKAVARKIIIFPSHPMYAFKFLDGPRVHYLEAHGYMNS